MSSENDVVTPSVASEHLTGRVKWFNNKAGYGFITVTDGPRSGSDIFVHHSVVNVENQQYKYLVQGEYVEFDLVRTQSEKHEWQASNVSGIKGGKLMCETRRELKVARTEYKVVKGDAPTTAEPKMPRQRAPRQNTGPESSPSRQRRTSAPRRGPRESTGDGKEWTLMTRDGPRKVSGRPPRREN
jgi:CspA family cold shock protein